MTVEAIIHNEVLRQRGSGEEGGGRREGGRDRDFKMDSTFSKRPSRLTTMPMQRLVCPSLFARSMVTATMLKTEETVDPGMKGFSSSKSRSPQDDSSDPNKNSIHTKECWPVEGGSVKSFDNVEIETGSCTHQSIA